MRRGILLLGVAALLSGCSLFSSDEGRDGLSATELKAAPETIRVDGKTLALQTYMWRDFMPVSPPNGKALIAVFRVYASDSQALPDDLVVDAAWVVNEDEVWDAAWEKEGQELNLPNQLEFVARDGPKWGPHIEVEAVVRILSSSNATHLLRASRQMIERTD